MAFVGLGAKGPHRRAAAGVQDPLLDGGGIGEAADDATEGIHFMHQLAFGWATNGGIAGLPGNPVESEGKQGGVQAKPRCCNCCFTTGMTTPDDDHVEAFGGRSASAHAFILQYLCTGVSVLLGELSSLDNGHFEGEVVVVKVDIVGIWIVFKTEVVLTD